MGSVYVGYKSIIFKIPHTIWKTYEGGIMKTLFSGKGQKSKLLRDDDTNQNLDNLETYYHKLKGQSDSYYFIFQLCQLLNIAMLTLNWWATDKFLGGNFSTYGTDVINYYSLTNNSNRVDPTCNTFPTKVGCDIKTTSTSGKGVTANGFCILSQNIINEKIYLFLWFWFVFMFVISALQMIYEIAIFVFPSSRSFIITWQTGTYMTREMKTYIEHDCHHGDWFILHQIGQNTNKDFFHNFIEKVSLSGPRHPKDNGESEKFLPEYDYSNTVPMKEMEARKN